ncbi:MAG TPA: HIT family protein [Methanolinea sp.]|nr:HIT family protein [Methanolinea sp.]
MNCLFCNPNDEDIILKNLHGYARYDGYPVSPGHLLIIPFRHVSSLFELSDEEVGGLWSLVKEGRTSLNENFHPDGFNVGVNVGEAAGQTVFHVHIHLIPRYHGDVENPKGGVRGVIPGKMGY